MPNICESIGEVTESIVKQINKNEGAVFPAQIKQTQRPQTDPAALAPL